MTPEIDRLRSIERTAEEALQIAKANTNMAIQEHIASQLAAMGITAGVTQVYVKPWNKPRHKALIHATLHSGQLLVKPLTHAGQKPVFSHAYSVDLRQIEPCHASH